MKVLFIGGTGIISSACARRAIASGLELDLLCRGLAPRALPQGARVLSGDVRDLASARAALGERSYDAVVDFVAFTPEHVERALALFRGRTGQYVFISSASAYHKPVRSLPITEASPLHNPFWKYSRDKIACEQLLMRAYREQDFPVTIVRPSHTYDETLLPFEGGTTTLHRMQQGKPVIVHGDGTSLWVLTHHADFAVGLVGLIGNPAALGETFHITSDELLTWNQIFLAIGAALGRAPQLVHVPSEQIARLDAEWGASLLGDKAHSVIFDNTKVKRLVPEFRALIPFHRGAHEVVSYYQRHPERVLVDARLDALMDQLVERYC